MPRCPLVAVIAVTAMVGLAGCSSLAVQSDYDHEVDFSGFRTYAWLEPSDAEHAPRLPDHLDIRLRRVVGEILDDKGFEPARAPQPADLVLVYYLDVNKELRVDVMTQEYYGGYGYYGAWPSGVGATTARVRTVSTGTLVLDVIDRAANQLVWTGSVAGTARHENPSGDRVQQVMSEMLKNFPPNP